MTITLTHQAFCYAVGSPGGSLNAAKRYVQNLVMPMSLLHPVWLANPTASRFSLQLAYFADPPHPRFKSQSYYHPFQTTILHSQSSPMTFIPKSKLNPKAQFQVQFITTSTHEAITDSHTSYQSYNLTPNVSASLNNQGNGNTGKPVCGAWRQYVIPPGGA